jgi:RNA polymerase sigma factor (sigma-70 family)
MSLPTTINAETVPVLTAREGDGLPLADASGETVGVSALALPPEGFETYLAQAGRFLDRRYREIDTGQTALESVLEALAYAVKHPIRNLSALVMCVARRKGGQALARAQREVMHAVPEEARQAEVADDLTERLAMQAALKEALRSLADDERAMFLAHYVCGYSHEEISIHFRTSVSAVKSRLLRLRRRLKAHPSLAEYCPEPEHGGSPDVCV